MNRERKFKVCLDRLEYFTYEISGWNRALMAVQKGMPFQEAIKEEMFVEKKMRQNRAFHALAIMIEHLLLLKMNDYTNDRKYGNWGDTVRTSRIDAAYVTEWYKKERDTALTEYLSGALQDIYEVGVKRYQKVSGHYPDRADRSQSIPEHCPWSLEELLDSTVDELLGHLPD